MVRNLSQMFLASACAFCSTFCSASELADRLEKELQQIPLIDTHCHVPAPSAIEKKLADRNFRYDVVWSLSSSTYVAEFLGGKDWQEISDRLAVNAHHAYYRPFVIAFRDLYGMGPNDELDEQWAAKVSARMDTSHRQPGWYRQVLERANIRQIIWLQNEPLSKTQMELKLLQPMWNIDWQLVYVAGTKRKAKKNNHDYALTKIEQQFQVQLKTLAQMEKLIDDQIEHFFAKGGIGLKSTSAYFRPLDFDTEVDRDEAAEVYDKIRGNRPIDMREQKLLEDYLMIRVLDVVARLKRPIQFHTGNQQSWNLVANSSPLGLNTLLQTGRWADAKFSILHGGYPFVEEAITMTRYYDNAYLDLAWMPLFSPSATKRALADALDMLPGNQLMIGSDAANLEELYGTAKITRRIIAEVLAEKIESGFWTEKIALQAARRVMYQNAADLYGLSNSVE